VEQVLGIAEKVAETLMFILGVVLFCVNYCDSACSERMRPDGNKCRISFLLFCAFMVFLVYRRPIALS
jgi:predicted MFS family arabinose efflux permease